MGVAGCRGEAGYLGLSIMMYKDCLMRYMVNISIIASTLERGNTPLCNPVSHGSWLVPHNPAFYLSSSSSAGVVHPFHISRSRRGRADRKEDLGECRGWNIR